MLYQLSYEATLLGAGHLVAVKRIIVCVYIFLYLFEVWAIGHVPSHHILSREQMSPTN